MKTPLNGLVAASLQDLMDALMAYAEPLGYPLKSPTFLPKPDDGCALSGIDPPLVKGIFEQKLPR